LIPCVGTESGRGHPLPRTQEIAWSFSPHATFEKKLLTAQSKAKFLAHPRREGSARTSCFSTEGFPCQWSDPAGWPTVGRRGRAGHGTPIEPGAPTGRAPAIGGPHDAPHRSIQPIRPSRPEALGRKNLKSANVNATRVRVNQIIQEKSTDHAVKTFNFPYLFPERTSQEPAPMATAAQIEANRRNAQRSTGPKTDEGKCRARCNALRHGMAALTIVPALPQENPKRLEELTQEWDSDVQPQNAIERNLVRQGARLSLAI